MIDGVICAGAQGAEAQRGLFLETLQVEAGRTISAAAAMPLAVQKAGATLAALEAGDIKLRVRVLESERADRRQGVLQVSSGPGFRWGASSILSTVCPCICGGSA